MLSKDKQIIADLQTELVILKCNYNLLLSKYNENMSILSNSVTSMSTQITNLNNRIDEYLKLSKSIKGDNSGRK